MLLCSSHVFKSTPRSPKDLAQVHYLQVALQIHAILAPFTPCLETNFQKGLSEMTEGAQVHPFNLLSKILHTPSCTETHSLPPHANCIKRIIKRCNTSSPPLSWSSLFCREQLAYWEKKKELPCGPQSTIERPELIEKHKIEKEGGDTRAYRLTICMSQKRS